MIKDLRTILNVGDIIKFRNGSYHIFDGENFWRGGNYYTRLEAYNEKLELKGAYRDLDIIEIKSPTKHDIDVFGDYITDVKWNKEKSEMTRMFRDMTYAEAHKKMFTDIADGKYNNKREWLEDHGDFIPYNECFACDEAKRRKEEDELWERENGNEDELFLDVCEYCPLEVSGTLNGCLDGLYNQYLDAEGFKRFEAAYKIANLKWKEEE